MTTAPPTPSALESLPVELLHRILFYLQTQDILSNRLTSSTLAAVGIEYLQAFSICFKREHLHRLIDIANHPIISKRARSLYYYGRPLDSLRNFDNWSKLPPCPILRSSGSLRTRQPSPPEDLERAYDEYIRIRKDQHRIVQENFDVHCFTELLRCCPALDSVIIDQSVDCGKSSTRELPHTAFREARIDPKCDHVWRISPEGCSTRPTSVLARALSRSQRSIRSLTLVGQGYLDVFLHELASPQMSHLAQGLRELSIYRTMRKSDERVDVGSDASTMEYLLSRVPNLEVLKIREARSAYFYLGSESSPRSARLRELDLADFHLREDDLVWVLKPHFSTLERLSLKSTSDRTYDWSYVDQMLQGRFTRLRSLNYRGMQLNEEDLQHFVLSVRRSGISGALRRCQIVMRADGFCRVEM